MARTYVVTGAASGIGRATVHLLTALDHVVVTLDRHDADVVADLSTPAGRAEAVEGVRAATGGIVDAVIASAGLALPEPATVAVNYFGTVATLEGLRPMLAAGTHPRAVVVSSMASFQANDAALVDACLAGDEPHALEVAAKLAGAEDTANLIYSSTKAALNRWMRRVATTPEWAGAHVPLNAVGPGVVLTPMTEGWTSSAEGRAFLEQVVPMPLTGFMAPEQVAAVLVFLASEENSAMTGQVVFVDGGSDVVLRGETAW